MHLEELISQMILIKFQFQHSEGAALKGQTNLTTVENDRCKFNLIPLKYNLNFQKLSQQCLGVDVTLCLLVMEWHRPKMGLVRR
jgi:hypothetical protein